MFNRRNDNRLSYDGWLSSSLYLPILCADNYALDAMFVDNYALDAPMH